MLLLKESVLSLKEKKQHNMFSHFQIARMNLTSFMTNSFNITFDNFGVWLLG